jgi:hypothetical protein
MQAVVDATFREAGWSAGEQPVLAPGAGGGIVLADRNASELADLSSEDALREQCQRWIDSF